MVIMLHTCLYILLTALVQYGVEAQDCENAQYKFFQTSVNSECYTSTRGHKTTPNCTYVCGNKPNVTYVIDVDKGVLIARFPLPPFECGHTLYKVDLMINERVQDDATCFEDLTVVNKHSRREYRIRRCENENCIGNRCEEYGEVAFNYVFTGCYKLRIEALVGTHSRPPLHSCPMFVKTNYTKLKIADVQPEMVVNYRQQENVCTLDVIYPQAISKTAIEFNLSENESRVNWAEVSVKAGIDSKGSTCIPSSKAIEPTCNFPKDNIFKEIRCTFYNVSPGNYCVRIRIDDDRCVPGTIWTTNNTGCRWSHPFVIEDHPPDKRVIDVFTSPTVVVVLSLLGVIFGVVLVVGFWLRKRSKLTNRSQAESPDEVVKPMIDGLKVLLLYPRDCQDFMNTMESFRKLLETYNVEVYDCHASDEVLNGPTYWLQKVIAYPKLCTIVVNSHCAYLQQQAIQRGCNTNSYGVYKDPVFIDSVFTYGLKVIMEDVSADTYLKNYVIGFSGFSSDEKMLSLPTSFRRYNIPEHLPKLFLDMNLEITTENIQLINSSEYIELQNNVKNLMNYVSMNPQYLENILNLV